jgi:hypothetical protein
MKFQIVNETSDEVKYPVGVRHEKETGLVCVYPETEYVYRLKKNSKLTEEEVVSSIFKWGNTSLKVIKNEDKDGRGNTHYDLEVEVDAVYIESVEDMVDFEMSQSGMVYFNKDSHGTLKIIITYWE